MSSPEPRTRGNRCRDKGQPAGPVLSGGTACGQDRHSPAAARDLPISLPTVPLESREQGNSEDQAQDGSRPTASCFHGGQARGTARPSGSPSLTSPSFPPPVPTGAGTWTPPRVQASNSPGQSWLLREEPGHISRTSGPISTCRRASSLKNGSARACEDHSGGKGRGEQGSPDPPQPPPLTALSLRCQGFSITQKGESG